MPLRNKGQHEVRLLTVGGDIRLLRRYFWSTRFGGQFPVDAVLGITASAVSPGASQLCCSMGIAQDFGQGAEDLQRMSGLRVSKERLRQITECEGEKVSADRREGTLAPAWSADQAHVEGSGRTRVYVGADGVLVRTVTQEEKDKRRQQHAIRRRQRGRTKVGNTKPLPPARSGSNDRFKEMKIGLFYDQSKSRTHLFATEGDHEAFGQLMRQHADAIGFEAAREQISLTDGAPWIRKQLLKRFKHLEALLLDFYHLSEHVWETATCCLGPGDAATEWVKRQLTAMKEIGYRAVLADIDVLRKKVRSKAKKESLRLLRQYILERWEMVDYRQALARGWDIGSGPTEAACKNLTLRLKRTGMKWDTDHAAAVMNLVALRESGQWSLYWRTRKTA
jgi:hypothetical protein